MYMHMHTKYTHRAGPPPEPAQVTLGAGTMPAPLPFVYCLSLKHKPCGHRGRRKMTVLSFGSAPLLFLSIIGDSAKGLHVHRLHLVLEESSHRMIQPLPTETPS